jgi:anti-sigma-K factor RskA
MAAGFAFLAFLPQPGTPDANGTQFVAALGPLNAAAPLLARARSDGSIAITRLTNATPPAGHDFQLWALPRGATRPVSLGVLPPGETLVRPPDRPLADEQLLVSEEPAGGSTTGQPTGPVLWGGTLTPVSPAPAPGQ